MRSIVALLAGICATAVAIGGASAATGTTVTVTPANMQGWSFVNDQTNGPGSGQLVSGPAGQPLGTGSAQLAVTGPADGQILGTAAYLGTRLADLTALDYWSYQSGPTLAIALQFDVRYRPSDTAYGGRLVFEPYQTVGVVPSGWTEWNALNGRWWSSRTTPAGSNGLCPQASPCTWAQVLANWPDAAIAGRVLFKAGSGWTPFTGNVDAFTIGAGTQTTTYDFNGAVPPPTSKDQCKHGGWATFNDPAFRNQGECVAYVEHARGHDQNDEGPDGEGDHSGGHED